MKSLFNAPASNMIFISYNNYFCVAKCADKTFMLIRRAYSV